MYSSSLNNFNYLEDFIDNDNRNEEMTKKFLSFHFLFVLNSQIMRYLFRIAFDLIFKSSFSSNL